MASGAGLHEHAVQAEAHLERLAIGLAESGAAPETTEAVSKMADVVRKIVKALGGEGQEPAEEAAQQPSERPSLDSATADMHREVQARAAGGA